MDEFVSLTLTLSRSEALVLFELLSRYSDAGKLEVIDQAEQRVLWDLCATLERLLPELFAADYSVKLKAAREQLRDRN